MDHGVVHAQSPCFLHAVLVKVFQAAGIAHAQSQMAGGILVKEGVVKQDAALPDRALIGHKSTLAQHGGTLVHGQHQLQGLLVFLRVGLHYPALFKAQGEILNEHAPVGQGHGGVNHALRIAAFRGSEHLFGGDVGIIPHVLVRQLFRPAAEEHLGHQANGKVRAGGLAFIDQAAQIQGIQPPTAAAQSPAVLLPVGDGILSVRPGAA